VAALEALGGAETYQAIYAEVAARRSDRPESWQAIIRRTIEQASSDTTSYVSGNPDLFYSVQGIGQGVWGLRSMPADFEPSIAENPATGQGYAVDSVVRTAIEKHAVRMAIEHYQELGASQITELGKPYDLLVLLNGKELHVEVKGSTRELATVTLTRNEVAHAQQTPGTELFVVDRISLVTSEDGAISTRGGRTRLWSDWVPNTDSLVPLAYTYVLPI